MRNAETMLTESILPFWLDLKDPAGGFFGEADGAGRIRKDADRGAVLNARILWTFSAAYRVLGTESYADAARWALSYFLDHFLDEDAGGVYWCLDASGRPLDDKKQLYAQAFAIYGLSEAALSLGDSRARETAVSLFRLVEKHYRDALYGGYAEALAKDFSPLEDMSLSEKDINAPKTMNSHLHLMEAYAALFRIWPDPGLEAALRALIDIIGGRMTGEDGHLRLYFERDWTVLPGEISCGHDIETSWLLMEAAEIIGDASLTTNIRPLSLRLGRAGNTDLRADGSLSGEWWTYAETVVGNLYLHIFHAEPGAMDNALRCWDYLSAHLVDREHGEWYWGLLPDGSPDTVSPKAGFWKCPYHNSRMCLELLTHGGVLLQPGL